MFELLKLLAGAAILAALGSLSGCSSYPSPDQKLGVQISVPGFGALDVGYSSGKAANPNSTPSNTWTVTPSATLEASPAPEPKIDLPEAPVKTAAK